MLPRSSSPSGLFVVLAPIVRFVAVVVVVLILVPWAWDGGAGAQPKAPADTPSQRFEALVDDYIDFRYRASPTLATRQGAHVYDDRLEDVSRAGVLNHVESLGLWARDLRKVGTGRLTPDQRADHDLMAADIAATLWEVNGLCRWTRDPSAYGRLAVQSVFPLLKPGPPGDAKRRLQVILARMRLLPDLLAHGRRNLDRPSGVLADAALQEMAQVQAFFGVELPRALEGVKDKRFLYEFREAHEALMTAVSGWRDFLRAELPSLATGDYRVGAVVMRARLRLEDPDLSPDRFVRQASEAVAQAQVDVRGLAQKMRPGAPVGEVLAEAARGALDSTTLAASVRERSRGLTGFSRASLCGVPEPFDVAAGRVPALLIEPLEFRADVPGPFGTGPAGVVLRKGAREGEAPVAHGGVSAAVVDRAILGEVVPGRGLRLLLARQAPTRLRRVMDHRSALDGWGPYASSLVLQGGFEPDNHALRLLAAHELLRAHAMALVAVQVHSGKMSDAEARSFLETRAWLDPEQARAALVEVARDPDLVSVSLGYLGLAALSQERRKTQGATFSPRAFHDAVLEQGLIPVRILKRILEGRYDKR